MDLYDDLDTNQRPGQVDGWSSGVKLLQSQLALKKASTVLPAPIRKDFINKKRNTVLAPVMLLKSKTNPGPSQTSTNNDGGDIFKAEPSKRANIAGPSGASASTPASTTTTTTIRSKQMPISSAAVPPSTVIDKVMSSYDWNIEDEYDPLWPNDYEKLAKERREKDQPISEPRPSGSRFGRDDRSSSSAAGSTYRQRRSGQPNRYEAGDKSAAGPSTSFSGFGGRPTSVVDEEESYRRSPPSTTTQRSGGVAIAPPPSLQESTPIIPAFAAAGPSTSSAASSSGSGNASGSVAAKIMARYGFRDGQGLGKQEQGMSMALQVEKTSKRGGRIIHEREKLAAVQAVGEIAPEVSASPPPDEDVVMQPPAAKPVEQQPESSEPSITEIMKAPSKVVLLRNMVGPGDVDGELEPEVKDECNGKYGEVVSVIINELQNVVPEEAVRIFVEFKRIESAIKAVVDLNGRFFAGRQVKAGFFAFEKYKMKQLQD